MYEVAALLQDYSKSSESSSEATFSRCLPVFSSNFVQLVTDSLATSSSNLQSEWTEVWSVVRLKSRPANRTLEEQAVYLSDAYIDRQSQDQPLHNQELYLKLLMVKIFTHTTL